MGEGLSPGQELQLNTKIPAMYGCSSGAGLSTSLGSHSTHLTLWDLVVHMCIDKLWDMSNIHVSKYSGSYKKIKFTTGVHFPLYELIHCD